MMSHDVQTREATSYTPRQTLPSPNVAADVVQVVLPPVLASGGMVLAFNLIRRLVGASGALRVARFINLLFASLLAGNGVGAMLAVHPGLRTLPSTEFFEAERAMTPRYGSIMRVAMPAAVVSCVNVLRTMPNRRSAAYGLTAAGTVSMVGMVVTTGIELPLNIQTMRTTPDDVSSWVASRERWDRFNLIRNVLTLAGWIFLCLALLSERQDGRRGLENTVED